tara:strand:+ start:303 stop:947 length:645 start_codon:yes stop_codon:yes gene_type:complete
MDEELSIISSNNRNERVKNFLRENQKKLISFLIIIILILIGFFGYGELRDRKQIQISNEYNSIIIDFNDDNKEITSKKLINLINKKDPTYSPLSLYFIIDNNLVADNEKINKLFNILIDETSLKKEIKYLVILKKALFNADRYNEGELLNTLNPLINSESVWRSHALHLIAEFFYSKDEKQKAKEFFNQIVSLENANPDIKLQAQKRLNRDLSE